MTLCCQVLLIAIVLLLHHKLIIFLYVLLRIVNAIIIYSPADTNLINISALTATTLVILCIQLRNIDLNLIIDFLVLKQDCLSIANWNAFRRQYLH